ncbi:hypothetical protein ABW19_dt0207705 [Dactylella cylindrospora]|nr:hypothetical protein ABW19_dt0207705 [Dactylella cylindrospora]
MHPSFIDSGYKQYKTDTDSVATWIANTAKSLGYPFKANGTPNSQLHQSRGRLKGKARKQAKAPTNKSGPVPGNPAAVDPVPKKTYKISISDFIALAKYIASYSTPAVTVPSAFFRVLDRAIEVRQAHGEAVQEVAPDQESDDSHTHFINVLQRVRDILIERKQVQEKEDENKRFHPTRDIQSLLDSCSNRFNGLTIEEPSESAQLLPEAPALPTKEKLPQNSDVPTYSLEVGENPMEEFFAVFMTIQELEKIRDYVTSVWSEYVLVEGSPIMPAVVTNMAIIQVQRIEEDLKDDFPRLSGYQDIGRRYFGMECSKYPGEENTRSITVPLLIKYYELAMESMYASFTCIKNLFWGETPNPAQLTINDDDNFGIHDPKRDRSTMSNEEKFEEDKYLIGMSLSDLMCWAKIKDTGAEDETFKAVRLLVKLQQDVHKIPLWVVFAVQLILDIHHELRHRAVKPFSDLQRTANEAKQIISRSREYHNTGDGVRIWDDRVDKDMQSALKILDRITEHDELYETYRHHYPRRPPITKFRYLRISPLRCGMLTLYVKTIIQQHYADVLNNCGSIMYTMHLYHAARREKHLPERWDDMELLLKLYGDQAFFIGDAPSNREDALTRFQLAYGVSVTQFATNKRQKKKNAKNKVKPEIRRFRAMLLDTLTPVTEIFMKQCFDRESRLEATVDQIEGVIYRSIPAAHIFEQLGLLDDGSDNESDFSEEDSDEDSDVEEHGSPGKVSSKKEEPESHKTKAKKGKKSKDKGPTETPDDREQNKENGDEGEDNASEISESKLPRFPRWMMGGEIATLEFLQLLEISLSYECPLVDIDYFVLHQQCFELLRTIRREFRPTLEEINWSVSEVSRDERGNGFLLEYVFMAAIDESRPADMQLYGLKTKDSIGLFERVAKVVEQSIEEHGGDVICTELSRQGFDVDLWLGNYKEEEEESNAEGTDENLVPGTNLKRIEDVTDKE